MIAGSIEPVASVEELLCPVCKRPARLLKQEERDGKSYRSFQCGFCRSIFCADRHEEVSPDYVDRTEDDITDDVLWCQGGHKADVFDQLFSVLRGTSRKINSVLDIGCGTGGFLTYAKTHGVSELYGFDAAAAQVRFAQSVSSNVRSCVSVEEYVNLIRHTPHWDLITLWDVIEHIRYPQALLSGIHKYCHPDTVVFICTPNASTEYIKLHLRRLASVAHSFVPWEHVLYYSPQGIRIMLEEVGFDVVSLTGAVCYRRPLSAFEIVRRAAFAVARPTRLAPQLFVLARKSSSDAA